MKKTEEVFKIFKVAKREINHWLINDSLLDSQWYQYWRKNNDYSSTIGKYWDADVVVNDWQPYYWANNNNTWFIIGNTLSFANNKSSI